MADLTTTTNVLGAVAGATIAVATAPIWVPFFGLGVVAAAVGTAGTAAVGGALGWLVTKPTPEHIAPLLQQPHIQSLMSRR